MLCCILVEYELCLGTFDETSPFIPHLFARIQQNTAAETIETLIYFKRIVRANMRISVCDVAPDYYQLQNMSRECGFLILFQISSTLRRFNDF